MNECIMYAKACGTVKGCFIPLIFMDFVTLFKFTNLGEVCKANQLRK